MKEEKSIYYMKSGERFNRSEKNSPVINEQVKMHVRTNELGLI